MLIIQRRKIGDLCDETLVDDADPMLTRMVRGSVLAAVCWRMARRAPGEPAAEARYSPLWRDALDSRRPTDRGCALAGVRSRSSSIRQRRCPPERGTTPPPHTRVELALLKHLARKEWPCRRRDGVKAVEGICHRLAPVVEGRVGWNWLE